MMSRTVGWSVSSFYRKPTVLDATELKTNGDVVKIGAAVGLVKKMNLQITRLPLGYGFKKSGNPIARATLTCFS